MCIYACRCINLVLGHPNVDVGGQVVFEESEIHLFIIAIIYLYRSQTWGSDFPCLHPRALTHRLCGLG